MKWGKRNILSLSLAVISVMFALLFLEQCERSSDFERDVDSVKSFYELEKDQLISRDSIVAHNTFELEQNLVTESTARKILQEEFERFKEINSHVRFESITRVDTFFIAYKPDSSNIIADYTDYIPVDTVAKHFIQIPKGLTYSDQWFSFNGKVSSDGLDIDSMSMINKFDVTIGWKKPDKPFKFLRKKEPVVELISYNPYSEVNYVNNIVVDDRNSSIFTSKPAMLISGAVGGYVIAKIK